MGKFVMVIDDSQTVRKIIETCLRRENFDVHGFADGIEAMHWITSNPHQRVPDLILLDINLPKIDGYEVARRIKTKSAFNKTIIIMLSRRDSVIDRLKGRLAGAKDYITKPFKTQEVVAIVQEQLNGHAAEEENV